MPIAAMAVSAGLEPATFGLGNRCSIRLSYETDWENVYFKMRHFERPASFESPIDRVDVTLGRRDERSHRNAREQL
jgi:hypothetical protein